MGILKWVLLKQYDNLILFFYYSCKKVNFQDIPHETKLFPIQLLIFIHLNHPLQEG